MNISKTMVVGINMHGELHLKQDGSLRKDIVPNNFRINVVNAVAPGVTNIISVETIEKISEKISNKIKHIKNWDKLTKKFDKLSEGIQDLLVRTNKKQAEENVKEHQRLYAKNKVHLSYQEFANSCEHTFKITSYESGDTIPDKLYLKFEEEKILNPDNIEENYFNKITLYNLEGEPDVFEMMKSVGLDIDQITTAQLIEFLSSLGVENLIIVDLSCSVFKGDSKHLSERNIRYMRRKMLCK